MADRYGLYGLRRRGQLEREKYREAALEAGYWNRESPALTAGGQGETLGAVGRNIAEARQLEGDTYDVRMKEAERAMRGINEQTAAMAQDAFDQSAGPGRYDYFGGAGGGGGGGGAGPRLDHFGRPIYLADRQGGGGGGGDGGLASSYAAQAESRRARPATSLGPAYYTPTPMGGVDWYGDRMFSGGGGGGGRDQFNQQLAGIGQWAGAAQQMVGAGAAQQFGAQTLDNFKRRYDFGELARRVGAQRVGELEHWARMGMDREKNQYQQWRDVMADARQERRDWLDEQRMGLAEGRAERGEARADLGEERQWARQERRDWLDEQRMGLAERRAERGEARADLGEKRQWAREERTARREEDLDVYNWARLGREERRDEATEKRETEKWDLYKQRYGEEAEARKSRQSLADDYLRRGYRRESVEAWRTTGDDSLMREDEESGLVTAGTARGKAKVYTDKEDPYLKRNFAMAGLVGPDGWDPYFAPGPIAPGEFKPSANPAAAAARGFINREQGKYRPGDEERLFHDAARFADPKAYGDLALMRAGVTQKMVDESGVSEESLQGFRDRYNEAMSKAPAGATMAQASAIALDGAWPKRVDKPLQVQQAADLARAGMTGRRQQKQGPGASEVKRATTIYDKSHRVVTNFSILQELFDENGNRVDRNGWPVRYQ